MLMSTKTFKVRSEMVLDKPSIRLIFRDRWIAAFGGKEEIKFSNRFDAAAIRLARECRHRRSFRYALRYTVECPCSK